MIFYTLSGIILLLPLLTNMLKNGKKVYCIVVSIAFILIAGLRSYMVGTDTPRYISSFLFSDTISLSGLLDIARRREFLFYIYQSIIRTLTIDYSVYLMPIAAFSVSIVSFFIYKYSETPTISYIIFMSMGYFSFSMAGLRQTIANAILLIATHYLLKKKYITSAVLVFLASGFHITSLFYLIVYIVNALPLNSWYLVSIGIAIFIAYSKGASLLILVTDIVWGNQRSYSKAEYGGISMLILLIIVAVAALFLYPGLMQRDKKLSQPGNSRERTTELLNDRLFTKLLFLAIPLQLMAIYQANIFRIAMMFHLFVICLIPNVIRRQKNQWIRFVSRIIVVVLLLVQLFYFTSHTADILPYTFYWQLQ